MLSPHKIKLKGLLLELLMLVTKIGQTYPQQKELEAVPKNMRTLLESIDKPFLFVVVGQVNAGKSSFINALLGQQICEVNPIPETDAVYEIVYSPQEFQIELQPHLKQKGLPIDILRTISIVDTPGANSMAKKHEEITNDYLPSSNLVVFVLSALNPHTKSAWKFMEQINQWNKKVVFVLQQADRASAEELTANHKAVFRYAQERGIQSPIIFCTSAKWEYGSRSQKQKSNFNQIRQFIKTQVIDGQHYKEKLLSTIDTCQKGILEKLSHNLEQQGAIFEQDNQIKSRIEELIERSRVHSQLIVQDIVRDITERYDRRAKELKKEFRRQLGVLSIFRKTFEAVFSTNDPMNSWVNELQVNFENDLRAMSQEVLEKKQSFFTEEFYQLLFDINAQLKHASLPQEDDDQRLTRTEILENAREGVSQLIQHISIIRNNELGVDQFSNTALGVSAAATLGTFLIIAKAPILFDFTGGLMTFSGVTIASSVVVFRRRKLIKDLDQTLASNRLLVAEKLEEGVTKRINSFYSVITGLFSQFFKMTENNMTTLNQLADEVQDINQKLERLNHIINV